MTTCCRSSLAHRSPSGVLCCSWRPCTSFCSRAASTRWRRSTTRWPPFAVSRPALRLSNSVAAVFADFCHLHRAAIERLVATRSTQTNEVGRCSALLPGLCLIASQYEWNEPLSLLDLGTSAGLNLLFDDYAYTYRAAEGGAVAHRRGD